MKILLSVFECNPLRGSDSYIGWSYTVNAAKVNEIWALTREDNREDIEKYCSENYIESYDNIHFIYIRRSKLFAEYLYRVNRYLGFLGSYFEWQKRAYKEAKKICAQENIDICHHVSIADFRCAGYLWKLPVPFIFGPVGGAQETPDCLKSYTKGHEKGELFRSFMNYATTLAPAYKKGLRQADLVFCSNGETKDYIIKRLGIGIQSKLVQMTELGIDKQYIDERTDLIKGKNGTVHILVSGRLIYRKGVKLLLDAVKKIKTDIPYQVDIFGDGQERNMLLEYAVANNIDNKVVFHGKVDFAVMQERYKEADIYVLPSLRETTGTAVMEAMANKLPVVSLNQNGVKYLVESDSGILVDVESREQVIDGMADALRTLIENQELRIKLGESGYSKIKDKYTWEKRVKTMNDIYIDICGK